jgi:uncharacterized protein (TIGR02452 family)
MHLLDDDKTSYSQCTTPMKAKLLSRYVHEPNQWIQYFTQFTSKATLNRNGISSMRILIMNQTMDACKFGKYDMYEKNDSNSIVTVQLDKTSLYNAGANTRMIHSDSDEEELTEARKKRLYNSMDSTMEVKVMIGDCLEAALLLKQQYGNDYPVAVLNMADAYTPGGGYKCGSGAQEENLHRRTNLFQCLDDPDGLYKLKRNWRYPIPEFSGIFTPNAIVFRSSEAKGYSFYSRPQEVNFITIAAFRRPETFYDDNKQLMLTEEKEEGTETKIRLTLDMAILYGMKSVVLSAFGCGAYKNPPLHVAQIFQKVLSDYQGAFQHVYFAIFNDHNSHGLHNPDGNIVPFETIFGKGVQVEYDE